MSSFEQAQPYVLPMPLLDEKWQESISSFKKLVDQLPLLKQKSVIVDAIDTESTFFVELHKILINKSLSPEYTLQIEFFLKNKETIVEKIRQGVAFSVLIYEPLPVVFVDLISEISSYSGSLKFVIIARKDWDWLKTYRSFPFFIREQLHLDFPTSLSTNDSFYRDEEKVEYLKKISVLFLGEPVKPYCPNIKIESTFFSASEAFDFSQEIKRRKKAVCPVLVSSLSERVVERVSLSEEQLVKLHKKDKRQQYYKALFQYSPQVVFDGHVNLITQFFKDIHRTHTWKLGVVRDRFIGRLGFLSGHLSRVYWKVRSFFDLHIFWRFSLKQIGWFVYRISFPIRKIYYIFQYQYEKRIVGLYLKDRRTKKRAP